MDSSLIRLPPDFEQALADLRSESATQHGGPLDVQVWTAGAEVAIAVAYRAGRGQQLRGRWDGDSLHWIAEDGVREQTKKIDIELNGHLGAGLLVVYLDPETNSPAGEGILTQQGFGDL